MALDSLLASLKNGVTEVTRGTASNSKVLRCNPEEKPQVTRVTTHGRRRDFVTPVTPCNPAGVTLEPLPLQAVPSVTRVTPEIINVGAGEQEQKAAIISPVSEASNDVQHDNDDRCFCGQCLNLQGSVCSIACPGGVVSANRGYRPVLDLQHRCAGFTTD